MAFTNSERGQFVAIVPDNPATPTVPAHLQDIVDAVEEQVILKATDWAWADTFIAPYTNGMVIFVESEGALFLRVGGAWRKLSPTNYSGTTTPSPALGADGDLYFLTTP
jgi:hypothetical protein